MWTFMSTSGIRTTQRNPVLAKKIVHPGGRWRNRNYKSIFCVEQFWEYWSDQDSSICLRNLTTKGTKLHEGLQINRRVAYLQPGVLRNMIREAMIRPQMLLVLFLAAVAFAQAPSSKEVEAAYPNAHALYLDLHQNPELSAHETQTATKLAGRLRALGYDVTEHVGGTGIVAVTFSSLCQRLSQGYELRSPFRRRAGLLFPSLSVHTHHDEPELQWYFSEGGGGRDVGPQTICERR